MLGTIFYRIKNSWVVFYILVIFAIAIYFNERYTILLFNELGGITVFCATVLLFSLNFIIFGFRYRAERNRRKVILFWCMLFILEFFFIMFTVFFMEIISWLFSLNFEIVFDSWVLRVTKTYSHEQLLNACYSYAKFYKGMDLNLKQLEMLIQENYNLADVYKTVDVYCGFLNDPTQFYPNYIYRSIDLWLKEFAYDYTWRKYMLETSWFNGVIENNKVNTLNLLNNLELYEKTVFYFPYTDLQIYRFSNYWYAYNWGLRNIEMMETKLFYDHDKKIEEELMLLLNKLDIKRKVAVAFCGESISLADPIVLQQLAIIMGEEEVLSRLIANLKHRQEEHFLRFFWILCVTGSSRSYS